MFRKQSFWKGSALLLASAMIAKLLGACFKIPLTNVLGGTGMGYFSTAYGLLLPVYALSVTGLSAAVAQTVSRAAALEHWAEVRRIRDTARLACGVLGLFLSLCMFLLAEPFAALVAAQPYALFSLLAIAPAALFGCLTAVERGYWEGLQNMTPTAVSQALEAVAKLGLGLALCQWVLAHPEIVCRRVPADVPLSALAAAGAVLGVTLSTAVGWLYFLLRGLRSGNRLPRGNAPAAPMGQIFRRLLYVMIPVALGSLVTNLTSLLDLVTMMRCLGRAQMLHSGELLRRFGTAASAPDFPAFVYGSFTGMAITVFNLVPSVTNMLGKSALPCAAALWAKQDREGVAAHIRSVTGAAAAMALPAAGGLWALAEPVMHILYAGRPEEAAIAAEALRTLLPGMVCLCLTFPLCSILQGVGKAAVPVVCMLAGVGVKLLGNLVLIPRPAFCITGAGIATSLCYLVLLGLILWQLRRCLEKPLHLMRTLLPIVLAAGCCTAAAWFCRERTAALGMLPSAAAAAAGGCLVYLAVLYLLVLRRRKQTVSIPLNKGKQTAESAPER